MLTDSQKKKLARLNTERREHGLRDETESEYKAKILGWVLHSQKKTSRGLTSFEFRTRGGGLSRVINAVTEADAVKALTRPQK